MTVERDGVSRVRSIPSDLDASTFEGDSSTIRIKDVECRDVPLHCNDTDDPLSAEMCSDVPLPVWPWKAANPLSVKYGFQPERRSGVVNVSAKGE